MCPAVSQTRAPVRRQSHRGSLFINILIKYLNMTIVFFIMIGIQCVAYLWFQGKGGLVSHRNFMIAHACLMIGQAGQAIDSVTKGAYASFTVSAFFLFITAFGIVRRYMIMRHEVSKSILN